MINCSEDRHVFATIASIDEDVEIIVSLTPNATIQQLLENCEIKYVLSPKGNQAVTTNQGIEAATNDKVILIDSDCYFAPGAIQKFSVALDTFDIVNGCVAFESNGGWLSKAIADCRGFDNSYDNPIYKPGLGIRKKIVNQFDGFCFNSLVPWTDDADFSYRIKSAGIITHHIEDVCVPHMPITLKKNLVSSFNYGRGDYLRHHFLDQRYEENFLFYEWKRYVVLFQQQPLSSIMVMLLNDFFYHCGYLYMALASLVNGTRRENESR